MATASTAARVDGARFLRRAPGGGCARCSRELAGAYLIAMPDGTEVTMGRRCASRTLGWATTRVEMAAVQAERYAEVVRRRALLAAHGFPVYDDTDPFTGYPVIEDLCDHPAWRDGDQAALDKALEVWAWNAHWYEQEQR